MNKRTRELLFHLAAFPAIVVAGISPILVAALAGFIAMLFGENLNEANPPDIPIIGDWLYAMGVMGWFALGTVPLAALAFVGYTGYFIFWAFKFFGTPELKDSDP
jgi:hypothetical protein